MFLSYIDHFTYDIWIGIFTVFLVLTFVLLATKIFKNFIKDIFNQNEGRFKRR